MNRAWKVGRSLRLSRPSLEKAARRGRLALPARSGSWEALLLLLLTIGSCCASAASPESRTLVVYSSPRSAYGLGHELEFLKLQLRRVNGRLDTLPIAEAVPARLSEASHVLVFCPEPNPVLSTNLLAALANTRRRVLWVGHLDRSEAARPLLGGSLAEPEMSLSLAPVNYRGRDWEVNPADWIPMRPPEQAGSRVVMSMTSRLDGGARNSALCWQHGEVWVFSALPRPGLLSFLLADALLDFYDATNLGPSRVALRIDDYQANSDHPEFLRKVDLLAARGTPFLVSVAPAWRMSPTGAVMNLDSAPEFVGGLRYAQARGGRLLMRGCVRGPDDNPEFWNGELDRPVEIPPEQLRRQVHQAAALMLKHGLLPLGWQTPHDAAPRAVYREVARVFSSAVERPQLSDLTSRETALLSAIVCDREGRQIVPENLGFLAAGSGSNGLGRLRRQGEFVTQLRGTVAMAYFHAYMPQDRLQELLDTLESLRTPFLDPLDLDHWVQVPRQVLLTGRAERKVNLAGGVLTWRAFDRAGRPVASEQEFALPGERLLQRKGRGAYELYQYPEGDPP